MDLVECCSEISHPVSQIDCIILCYLSTSYVELMLTLVDENSAISEFFKAQKLIWSEKIWRAWFLGFKLNDVICQICWFMYTGNETIQICVDLFAPNVYIRKKHMNYLYQKSTCYGLAPLTDGRSRTLMDDGWFTWNILYLRVQVDSQWMLMDARKSSLKSKIWN